MAAGSEAISGAGTGLINLFGHHESFLQLHLTRVPRGSAMRLLSLLPPRRGGGGYLDHEMATRDPGACVAVPG